MKFWYQQSWLQWLLLPFSWVFQLATYLRRKAYQKGIFSSWKAPCTVVVVGNLSVGGNGKTPLVITLVEQLQRQGIRVGVISRGYGGESDEYPFLVCASSDAKKVGDEPVLIAQRTSVPIAISPDRRQSIELLHKAYHPQVIISDDGLQHYKLQRDLELVVVDGERRFGNGLLLPAGPLRELPQQRLKTVDAVICNGGIAQNNEILMILRSTEAINLVTNERIALTQFSQVNAIAGIGYPPRFFTSLEHQGIEILSSISFPDHHSFKPLDFSTFDQDDIPLLMTEKDAVKCRQFAKKHWWYVEVTAEIKKEQLENLIAKIIAKVNK
ncbi:tetraacyldisaccharide 4'-kinase [Gallibacterium genomosp. 1]|uniref:Tetraacyldisaccharide 4'-kinase n=1 Tax=Gallibacterium genomosp. 1 TaxID=155515 RepID=A0A0A2Y5Q9_9PAST|nr:tetraacyldisaccharide 4'-kinase [Gallibacterium genomosp. 1]KGQ38477.1 tetraacyldisaccharide 4'-kinase [Gallibacterium genomosp. 1]